MCFWKNFVRKHKIVPKINKNVNAWCLSALPAGIYLLKVCMKSTYGVSEVALVSLLLTLNRFHTFWCFLCWLWTSKCRLGLVLLQFRLQLRSARTPSLNNSKYKISLAKLFKRGLEFVSNCLEKKFTDRLDILRKLKRNQWLLTIAVAYVKFLIHCIKSNFR